MNPRILLSAIVLATVTSFSCSSDDDSPRPVYGAPEDAGAARDDS